jgi:hypothetical protein
MNTDSWVYIYLKKCFSEREVTREGASVIRGKYWNTSPVNIEGTPYMAVLTPVFH